MIKVQNIRHSFGSKTVLRGIDFQLEDATLSGLIGPTGSGKSVFLKILAGVYHPTSGEVIHNIDRSSDISLMFQEGALFDSLTVFDNVAFPLVDGDVPADGLPESVLCSVRDQVEEILGHVGLKKAAFKIPAQLSGGMRRRVSLARALVSRPRVALLDDPTCGLDPVASSVIMDLIVELYKEYKPAILLVSHDLRRLLPVVEKVHALFDGKLVYSGSTDQISQQAEGYVEHFVSCRYDLSGVEGRAS